MLGAIEMRVTVSGLRRLVSEELESRTRAIEHDADVYCDMDGVLVDFEAGANELLQRMLAGDVDAPWARMPKIVRRIEQAREELAGTSAVTHRDMMGRAVKNLMFDAVGHHPEEFFANLSPLPDGAGDLWSFLTGSGRTVHILSAPIKRRSAAVGGEAGDGKRAWISANLAPQPASINIVPANQKYQYAVKQDGTPNVLIDDKPSNVDEWEQAGGVGVLHVPGGGSNTIARLSDIGL